MTEEMKVKLGKEFAIYLEANPTTGYDWEAEFDESILKLKDKYFEPDLPAAVGGGGKDKFVFLPVKTGRTNILMLYKRPWENKPLKEKVFQIFIG